MKFFFITLFFTFVCAASLKAQQASSFVLPEPVAVVDGYEIKAESVKQGLAAFIQQTGMTENDVADSEKIRVAHGLLDEEIKHVLLSKNAALEIVSEVSVNALYQGFVAQFPDRASLDRMLESLNKTEEALKRELREALKKQQWVEGQIASKIAVLDDEAKAFYKENPNVFNARELVTASHILIALPPGAAPELVAEKKKVIDAVSERLKKGESFEALVKEVSDDALTRDKEGRLEPFVKDAGDPEFARVAFSLKPGEVSEPFRTKLGFHLIKLLKHEKGRQVDFAAAEPRIKQYLIGQKRQKAVDDLVAELRAKANIKVNLTELPAKAE